MASKPPDFSTTKYWSESQKQLIDVAEMPLPYALNVFRKLMRDHPDEFAASHLAQTLMNRLRPSAGVLKSLLASKGEASFLLSDAEAKTRRAMFYRIGKKLGVTVTTEIKGPFMVATCEPVGEQVKVNRVHS